MNFFGESHRYGWHHSRLKSYAPFRFTSSNIISYNSNDHYTVHVENLLIADRKEKQLTIEQGNYHNGVPAIPVVVDADWSKCSHKYLYNASYGIGVIFGASN